MSSKCTCANSRDLSYDCPLHAGYVQRTAAQQRAYGKKLMAEARRKISKK